MQSHGVIQTPYTIHVILNQVHFATHVAEKADGGPVGLDQALVCQLIGCNVCGEVVRALLHGIEYLLSDGHRFFYFAGAILNYFHLGVLLMTLGMVVFARITRE